MVYVFGNPEWYGKKRPAGCSCTAGHHYFGCGHNGPYVYNALLASTGSPAFGTVQEPKRAKYACFFGRVCLYALVFVAFVRAHALVIVARTCISVRCAHMLISLFLGQDV